MDIQPSTHKGSDSRVSAKKKCKSPFQITFRYQISVSTLSHLSLLLQRLMSTASQPLPSKLQELNKLLGSGPHGQPTGTAVCLELLK